MILAYNVTNLLVCFYRGNSRNCIICKQCSHVVEVNAVRFCLGGGMSILAKAVQLARSNLAATM